MICKWCGAADTVAAFDMYECLVCGNHTTFTGDKTVPASLATEGVGVEDIPEPEPYDQTEPTPEPEPEPEPEPDEPADTPDE
jgi:hypothetical protein